MSLSERLQAARNQRPAGQSYVPPPEVGRASCRERVLYTV